MRALWKAMDDGFSSVMFDGSHYGIEENIEKTKEIIRLAAEKGISVEAEVGAIGGEEDGVVGGGEVADPDECKMIADLGVTMLAAGIGNIHGVYPENWQGLNFDVLAPNPGKTGTMPLVLHGGTGIPDEMVKKAITLGVSKVNVNTGASSLLLRLPVSILKMGRTSRVRALIPVSCWHLVLRRLRLPSKKKWSFLVLSIRRKGESRTAQNAPFFYF